MSQQLKGGLMSRGNPLDSHVKQLDLVDCRTGRILALEQLLNLLLLTRAPSVAEGNIMKFPPFTNPGEQSAVPGSCCMERVNGENVYMCIGSPGNQSYAPAHGQLLSQ